MSNFFFPEISGNWSIDPGKMQMFLQRVSVITDEMIVDANRLARKGMFDDIGAMEFHDDVAVIPVRGVIMKRVPPVFRMLGIKAASSLEVAEMVSEAANDPHISRIVLDIESPGGEVAGQLEAADAIMAAREIKPVDAFVDDLCASGAYWLASQASHIAANGTAEVGSIGVFTVINDYSKMFEAEGIKTHVVKFGEIKGAGVVGAEVSEAQLENMQKVIDDLGGIFIDVVSRGRDMPRKDAEKLATGALWVAAEALERGLIDSIGSRDVMLSEGRTALYTNTKEKTMAHEEARPAEAAADRESLTAMASEFEDHPEFALEQIKVGASLEDARRAYIDLLKLEIVALEAEIEQLSDPEEGEESEESEEIDPEAETVDEEGDEDSEDSEEPKEDSEEEPKEEPKEEPEGASASVENEGEGGNSGDFVQRAKDKATAEGIKVSEAMAALVKQDPEGYAAWRQRTGVAR